MCIAIVNKTGTLPLKTFQTAFKNNPDGIGIAWAEDGEVKTLRTMNAPDQLHERYAEIRKTNELPILIHARIGTHGVKDLGNCHPFKVSRKVALIHNGIVNAPTYRKDRSDTWHLVDLLKRLNGDLLDPNEPAYQWLDTLAGTSKVALLDASGRIAIIGESRGTWEDGTWYSNATYKESCSYIDRGGFSYGSGTDYYPYGYSKVVKGFTTHKTQFEKASTILELLGDDPDTLPYAKVLEVAREYATEWGYKTIDALHADCIKWDRA